MKKAHTIIKKLVTFFTTLYGEPTKVDQISNEVIWKGSLVRLQIDYDAYRENLSVTMTNIPVENAIEAATRDKMEKDKKDF